MVSDNNTKKCKQCFCKGLGNLAIWLHFENLGICLHFEDLWKGLEVVPVANTLLIINPYAQKILLTTLSFNVFLCGQNQALNLLATLERQHHVWVLGITLLKLMQLCGQEVELLQVFPSHPAQGVILDQEAQEVASLVLESQAVLVSDNVSPTLSFD